jgi:hypothetical protein
MGIAQAFAQWGGAWDTANDRHLKLPADLKIKTTTARLSF